MASLTPRPTVHPDTVAVEDGPLQEELLPEVLLV